MNHPQRLRAPEHKASSPNHLTEVKAARELEAIENGKYARLVQIHRPPGTLRERRTEQCPMFGGHERNEPCESCDHYEEVETSKFSYTLKFHSYGAAIQGLTWLLAAHEAYGAPTEEVQLAYHFNSDVMVTILVGAGWALPDGMRDFIGLIQLSPHHALFGLGPHILPHYRHVAARAVANPYRYEQIGAQAKAAIEQQAFRLIPDVQRPRAISMPDNNSPEARRHTQHILQNLCTDQSFNSNWEEQA